MPAGPDVAADVSASAPATWQAPQMAAPSTVTVTYLELTHLAALRPSTWSDPAALVVRCRPTATFYRFLLASVGGPWGWTSRSDWDDARLGDHLRDPAVALFLLLHDGCPAGFFELHRAPAATEIVYFGLAPEFIGRGLGGPFLTAAVHEAFAGRPARVWLHTCSRDAPAALPNYLARGFVVTRTAEEPG